MLRLIASIPSPPTDRLELGPLTFRFYGLMIALGVLAGVEIARRRWEERGGGPDDMIDLVKWAVPAGMIGARLYHVATDWRRFEGRWADIPKVWQGGLGIPGGLLLGVGVGYIYAKRRGWDIKTLLDAAIPGIPVAQAIGRLGNWFNQEIFGEPSSLPWAVEIDRPYRPTEFINEQTFHPMFLYEGLWNLALAGSLIWVSKKGLLKAGQILPLWIMGYGLGRFLIELMRTDEATEILGLRVNTWMSGIAVVGGLIWFLILGRSSNKADGMSTDEDAPNHERELQPD